MCLGFSVEGATGVYYTSFAVLLFVLWLSINLLRSPIGRAMVAIRDSEVSAQSMGIHLAKYKTLAFAISAGITGLAGALFAHYVRFLAPDAFDVLLSVQFVTIVFVGGLGSLRGAILGAIFVRLLPQAIAIVRDDLPFGIGRLPGLEPSLFGLVLVLVILFQPGGINGLVAEDETLVPGLSVQAPDQRPAAEILRAIGAPAMTALFEAKDISVRFGGIRAVDSVSFDGRTAARSSRSSARTAPARPRSSI